MNRTSVILAIVILSLSVVACGGASPSPASPPTEVGDAVVIRIVAKDIAFDLAEFGAPAGVPLRVELDNQDDGIPHNVALYGDAQFSTELGKSEIVNGPASTSMTVPGLVPGVYQFRCEVHPNMTATLTVEG